MRINRSEQPETSLKWQSPWQTSARKQEAGEAQSRPWGGAAASAATAAASLLPAAGTTAAAAGGCHVGGAELHTGLLAENVQLSSHAAALGRHHLAAKVGKAAAHHRDLVGGRREELVSVTGNMEVGWAQNWGAPAAAWLPPSRLQVHK